LNLKDFIVSEDNTVLEVMKVINNNAKGIATICGDNRKLLAVVTDGDIRRFILKNGDLGSKISEISNYKPVFITRDEAADDKAFMRKHSITALPVLGKNNKLLSIRFLYDNSSAIRNTDMKVPVVIMAGGIGSRLYPYTQILPKPLIPIGEETITEIIMDHFELYGCTHFDMIVNYKKNLIKSYFYDHEKKRDITFIDETEFLGTGGGLKLLEGQYQEPFFLTNCDIIIEDDYNDIMKYHMSENNIITMVSALKKVVVPYGTISADEQGQVKALEEKPSFSYLVNTGLYVIDPKFLEYIPKDTFIHITDVIHTCINSGEKVGSYEINEHSWMDMGQLEELEKMRERLRNEGQI
jgi:dTDP-glucose pyrophosphorylase